MHPDAETLTSHRGAHIMQKQSKQKQSKEWSGTPCPNDPDNYWIDDKTGERVCAKTGNRYPIKKDEEA